jgi:hypothetical protein
VVERQHHRAQFHPPAVFYAAAANRAFSAFLSLLLGFPHELWRQRHLRHHAEAAGGAPRRIALNGSLMAETALVVSLLDDDGRADAARVLVRLPARLAAGLGLCQLHGYFEHARGTTSHYGRLYNTLFSTTGITSNIICGPQRTGAGCRS